MPEKFRLRVLKTHLTNPWVKASTKKEPRLLGKGLSSRGLLESLQRLMRVTSGTIIRYSTVKQHRCRPCGKPPKEWRRRRTSVKRLLYLAVAALVAMLILVPTAMAQDVTMEKEMEMTVEKDLPKSGGVAPGSLALPAAALLVGGGILGYAVLRRR
jgi:hypothetical protein